MPATDAHIARAEENERFYEITLTLASGRYLHWSVTALFYAALHYIDACLHEHMTIANPRGSHYEDHTSRNAALRQSFPRL